MKMYTYVKNDKLHFRPKLKVGSGVIFLKTRVISPLRLFFLNHTVFWPLSLLWKVLLGFVLGDYALEYFSGESFFSLLLVPREFLACILLVAFIIWCFEKLFRYPLARYILGSHFSIYLSDKHIFLRRGLKRWRFSRHQALSIVTLPIESANTEIYRHSRVLALCIANTRIVKIGEVYDADLCQRISTNADVAIALAAGFSDRDYDPTRRPLG